MASPTYRASGIVLRKTKLKESDLIYSFLTDEGLQIQAIAKGARKPTSSFSSRLELFSYCDLLLVKGKSLDIVKEARLIEGFPALRNNYEAVLLGSPALELLRKVTITTVSDPRLFSMAKAYFTHLETVSTSQGLLLCTAFLIKSMAFLGFRPSFTHCVGCGSQIEYLTTNSFSSFDGGVVCASCFSQYETTLVPGSVIVLLQNLLMSSFDTILSFEFSGKETREALQLTQQLIYTHLGVSLKSLNYVYTQLEF
ncbi:MAG: DNA repair protein RecO [Anaerotardibacter sp.]